MRTLLPGAVVWLMAVRLAAAQAPALPPSSVATRVPDIYLDSVPQAQPASGRLGLSLTDAIGRALAYNLAAVSSRQDERRARAARLDALAELLPRVEATVSEQTQQVNLAAYGFGGFPGVGPLVGPFSVFDARAHLSQSVWDSKLRHDARAAREEESAGTWAAENVRDLVVVVTTNLYLQVLATASRVEAARSQLDAAQTFYDQAVDFEDSGLVAGIDVLRAQVELERERGRLIMLGNDLARQRLDLARAVGLPLGQDFELTSTLASDDVGLPSRDAALGEALGRRPDYQRALALVRAAEEDVSGARGQRRPTLALDADYGDIGRSPGSSHGTFTVRGIVTVPLFRGGEIRADVLEADARLETRRAEAAALATRIEYDVRAAYLDVSSAEERVRVAENARDLAVEELAQAQDRFGAGVAGSFEVVQAQETLAGANEEYVSSLYVLGMARASVARAIGQTQANMIRFVGGVE